MVCRSETGPRNSDLAKWNEIPRNLQARGGLPGHFTDAFWGGETAGVIWTGNNGQQHLGVFGGHDGSGRSRGSLALLYKMEVS